MFVTDWKLGSANDTAPGPAPSQSSGGWGNLHNTYNTSNSFATNSAQIDTNGTRALILGFDLDVPDGHVIKGLEFKVSLSDNNNTYPVATTWSVGQFCKAGVAVGTAMTPQDLPNSSSYTEYTIGGSSDLVGVPATPAYVNAADFGVILGFYHRELIPGFATASLIRWVQVRAHYDLPPEIDIPSKTFVFTGHAPTLDTFKSVHVPHKTFSFTKPTPRVRSDSNLAVPATAFTFNKSAPTLQTAVRLEVPSKRFQLLSSVRITAGSYRDKQPRLDANFYTDIDPYPELGG